MILEHALLRIRDGESDAFETAMVQAKSLIAASPGFRGIEVRQAVGTPSLYLLLVRWDDVASHRDGFRKSERYAAWRALLHGYYNPIPEVTYFNEPIDD